MITNDKEKIVLFKLNGLQYALYLSEVERIVHAVDVTPLPQAPDVVIGVINYQGKIIPVIDMRLRFQLPSREIDLDNQFIIAQTSKRLIVLVVDSVTGVHELEQHQISSAPDTLPFTNYLSGIAKIETDIILINDLEKFLSLDEEKILNEALSGRVK